MPKAIIFDVPNTEEASRTKSLLFFIMGMVGLLLLGVVTTMMGAGAKGGKGADLILCCATEGTGSHAGVNNTRIMYSEAYDVSTKCEGSVLLGDYVDSKTGSWMKDYTVLDKHMHTQPVGFVTPLVNTLVVPVVILLFGKRVTVLCVHVATRVCRVHYPFATHICHTNTHTHTHTVID
jgi:hypothetical protein